jgi:hypothetical protein
MKFGPRGNRKISRPTSKGLRQALISEKQHRRGPLSTLLANHHNRANYHAAKS